MLASNFIDNRSAIHTIHSIRNQLQQLDHAPDGTKWFAAGPGCLKRANFWRKVFETLKGWIRLENRTSFKTIEHEFIYLVSNGEKLRQFDRNDIDLIKRAAAKAGIILEKQGYLRAQIVGIQSRIFNEPVQREKKNLSSFADQFYEANRTDQAFGEFDAKAKDDPCVITADEIRKIAEKQFESFNESKDSLEEPAQQTKKPDQLIPITEEIEIQKEKFLEKIHLDPLKRISALGYLTLATAVPALGALYWVTSGTAPQTMGAAISFADAWRSKPIIQPYCPLEGTNAIPPNPMSIYSWQDPLPPKEGRGLFGLGVDFPTIGYGISKPGHILPNGNEGAAAVESSGSSAALLGVITVIGFIALYTFATWIKGSRNRPIREEDLDPIFQKDDKVPTPSNHEEGVEKKEKPVEKTVEEESKAESSYLETSSLYEIQKKVESCIGKADENSKKTLKEGYKTWLNQESFSVGDVLVKIIGASKDAESQKFAREAFGQLVEKDAWDAKEVAKQLVDEKDPTSHEFVKDAFSMLLKKNAWYAAQLAEEVVKVSDPELRKFAKDAFISLLGVDSMRAEELAEKFIDSEDSELREFVKDAFSMLLKKEKTDNRARALIVKLIDSKDPELREFAKEAFSRLLEESPFALRLLVEKFVDAVDPTLREFAKEVFPKFLRVARIDAYLLIQMLIKKENDEYQEFLLSAYEALLTLGDKFCSADKLVESCKKLVERKEGVNPACQIIINLHEKRLKEQESNELKIIS